MKVRVNILLVDAQGKRLVFTGTHKLTNTDEVHGLRDRIVKALTDGGATVEYSEVTALEEGVMTSAKSELWQKVWQEGIEPCLSDDGLTALHKALVEDDERLLQGGTCTPPPIQVVADWPAEAACAITYCGWQGDGLETVAEVEEYFARTCFEADQRLGEPGGVRHFINWFDFTPRDEMRQALIPVVEESLARRFENREEGAGG